MKAKNINSFHAIICPTLLLWIVSLLFVWFSDFRAVASIALPIFMVASFFLVLLGNACIGSHIQHKEYLDKAFDDITTCMHCGSPSSQLYVIDYEYNIVLFIKHIYTKDVTGKYCRECAEKVLQNTFLKNLFGCITCPPVIIWYWVKKERQLDKIKSEL